MLRSMAEWTRREALAMGAAAFLPLAKARVRPEYERALERALVCFPDASRETDPASLARFLQAAFRDLRSALPSYTALHVAARGGETEGAHVHVVGDPSIEIELWAQDVGEPMVIDGRERFLVSRRMPASMGQPAKMSADRKRVAEIVFGEDSVLDAPFVFEGGNLAFDSGRVMVGTNDISRTLACPGESRNRRQVLDDIGETFGGVEVIEIGRETQSPLLQHIDQAFVLLDGKNAVACRVDGGGLDAESRQLQHYVGQLGELGYRVHYLDHTASDLSGYRSSINVVPFIDRESKRGRILLPVFPGEVRESAKVADRGALVGKAARAFDLYRDLGYEPSVVRDVTHPLGGNVHCVLNVLS
jgi:agmatine/peptidylarginine deiminase